MVNKFTAHRYGSWIDISGVGEGIRTLTAISSPAAEYRPRQIGRRPIIPEAEILLKSLMTGKNWPLFQWLSFLFYLPVVLYVAIPFYRGAIASLKQRKLFIDLPMAVASLAGFMFSTLELLRGRDDIYFDSMSGFLFLILVSRTFQSHLQNHFKLNELLSNFGIVRSCKAANGLPSVDSLIS